MYAQEVTNSPYADALHSTPFSFALEQAHQASTSASYQFDYSLSSFTEVSVYSLRRTVQIFSHGPLDTLLLFDGYWACDQVVQACYSSFGYGFHVAAPKMWSHMPLRIVRFSSRFFKSHVPFLTYLPFAKLVNEGKLVRNLEKVTMLPIWSRNVEIKAACRLR
jgi:hypothetical protein